MGSANSRRHGAVLFCIALTAICAFIAFEASAQSCNVGGIRHDCCPGGCTEEACRSNGCCFSPVSSSQIDENGDLQGIPWCFHPNPPIPGYRLSSMTTTPYGFEGSLSIITATNVFGPDISPLRISVWMETKSRLRVKIYDPNNARWEVPGVVISNSPSTKPPQTDYIFSYVNNPFGFAVQRASTGETLFNTSSPADGTVFNGLIFEDQYLEISTQLPQDPNIYGLGERVSPLRLDNSGVYYTMFATDIGTPVNINLYGSHPFYLELRNSSSSAAHGVFLLNSNGIDVFLGPKQLTYRIIGGVLDFYFFLGPGPNEVIQQYNQVIGRPYMPPYWSLGWHQCRYGWETLKVVEEVVAKYAEHKIPLDTIWTDIDYMDKYYDFTWDPERFPVAEVQKFTSKLHADGQRYVPIIDAGIPNVDSYGPWKRGLEMDVFIKDKNGDPFIGKVWPGLTAFVDYFHPQATKYWVDEFITFLNTVPYDGIWIDMNEVSNFCDGACNEQRRVQKTPKRERSLTFDPNNPPYPINNRGSRQPLDVKTVAMDAQHFVGLEYNVHNLFGFMETNATRVALETVYNKRAFVISRSTFPGQGRYGSHWLGDNTSDWPDLYYAIPGMLTFNIFGIPLVGADICGFNGDASEELCARWMQVGAFYTFARNHNAIGTSPQEPYIWPQVAEISKKVLEIKYSLLPYYYTLFWEAYTLGGTVARPLFFEFPADKNCVALDKQFLIGPGFLVSPVLEQGATSVNAYFPKARWYDYYTHAQTTSGSQFINLPAPIDKINLHLRGGVIIPTQEPALTTTAARKNPFGLLVSLNETFQAYGSLYMDDGESLHTDITGAYTYIQYTVASNKLVAVVTKNGYSGASTLYLTNASINGVSKCPSSVYVNGQTAAFTCDPTVLSVEVTKFQVRMSQSWSLTWA